MSEEVAMIEDGDEEDSRRRSLRDHHEATYQYSFVLGLLLLTFFLAGALPQSRWVPLIMTVTLSTTLLMTLKASGSKHFWFIAAWTASILGVGSGIAQLFYTGRLADITAAGLTALLLIVGPIAIIRGVIRERQLNMQTVLAALSLYIMLGLFYALLFGLVQGAGGTPFFTDHRMGTSSTFIYFSFATMTTVGYGDFTAAANLGRTLSVSEAVLGQLYLVTVVALLVGNLGAAAVARSTKLGARALKDD